MPMLFDRLPEESDKAYAAFVEYLRLGAQRSVLAAAKGVGKSERTLARWQERFAWTRRASAYDDWAVEVERQTLEVATKSKALEQLKRREQLKELEWEVSRLALEKLRAFLGGQIVIKNVRDAAYLLDIASKVARLSVGLATEHAEVTGEGGGPIQVDIGSALKKVYGEVIDVQSSGSVALPGSGQERGMQRGSDDPVCASGDHPAAEAIDGERGGASV